MKTLIRTAPACALAAVLLLGPALGQSPPEQAARNLNVLVLLGEWFGDADIRLGAQEMPGTRISIPDTSELTRGGDHHEKIR